jgi:oligoribonuclease NrnB/cAMP/cGMP phosphodiesterase (DHH superfamily)
MEQLPDFLDEDTPLSVWVQYPGSWWGSSDDTSTTDSLVDVAQSLPKAEKVAITDSDADGLGSMVVLYEAFPDVDWTHIISGHGSHVIGYVEALEAVATSAPEGIEVYMTDIMPDDDELDRVCDALGRISETRTVHVFDHHDWSEDTMMRVDGVVDTLVVDKEDVCATDITFREVENEMAENNPDNVEMMREFAAVTRDHDLWIKQDTRSTDLSDYAFWAGADDYIAAARKKGAALSQNEEVAALLEDERWEQHERVRAVVEQSIFTEIGDFTVAFAYGSAYRSSVGEWLTSETELVLTKDPSPEFTPPTLAEKRQLPWNQHRDDVELDVWDHVEAVERTVINTSRRLTETETLAPEPDHSVGYIDREDLPERVVYHIKVTPEYADEAAAHYEQKADLAVLLLPWNKVSFRADGDRFPYCSKLAGELGGGGHPDAASCTPGVVGSGGMTDYGSHWETRGALTRAVVADKVMKFIDEGLPEVEKSVASDTTESVVSRMLTGVMETADVKSLADLEVDEREMRDGCHQAAEEVVEESKFIRDVSAAHVQGSITETITGAIEEFNSRPAEV